MTEWHKYPDEKPTDDTIRCFCTVKVGRSLARLVREYMWIAKMQIFDGERDGVEVIAWAKFERPKPYQTKNEEIDKACAMVGYLIDSHWEKMTKKPTYQSNCANS